MDKLLDTSPLNLDELKEGIRKELNLSDKLDNLMDDFIGMEKRIKVLKVLKNSLAYLYQTELYLN